jgi:hypothetical protein
MLLGISLNIVLGQNQYMKKSLLPVFALALLVSCETKQNGQAAHETVTANIVKQVPLPKNKNIGTWKAVIEKQGNIKGGKLRVTGSFNTKSTGPKPGLAKKIQTGEANRDILELLLSKEPLISTGKIASVKYEEALTDAAKYSRINIIYKDSVIAVINPIEGR